MNVRRAIEDYRSWGLLRFLHLCAMKLLRRRLTLCGIYARPHVADFVLPALPDNREVRIATADELVEAGKDPVYDLDPEFIDFSMGKGDLCAGVFEDDRLLAYYWRATTPTPHLDSIWVEPGSGFCYSYKAFTHPACRQQGLQEHVARFTDAVLSQRGFTGSIGFIETHNFPSIKASLKRGSQKVGYAGYLRVFGKILPFRTPGAKRHGFRFFLSSE